LNKAADCHKNQIAFWKIIFIIRSLPVFAGIKIFIIYNRNAFTKVYHLTRSLSENEKNNCNTSSNKKCAKKNRILVSLAQPSGAKNIFSWTW